MESHSLYKKLFFIQGLLAFRLQNFLWEVEGGVSTVQNNAAAAAAAAAAALVEYILKNRERRLR